MKRELKPRFFRFFADVSATIAEPIPMKRELKLDNRAISRARKRRIAEPIPMKRELKLIFSWND